MPMLAAGGWLVGLAGDRRRIRLCCCPPSICADVPIRVPHAAQVAGSSCWARWTQRLNANLSHKFR